MKNRKRLLIWLLLFLGVPSAAFCQTYVTWQGLEPDKLASMWLIKRFVDQDAEFILIPKGEDVKNGIPFDIPSAKFKRSHALSAFESILQDQELKDDGLNYIGTIIHDIEINTWDIKKIAQTYTVQQDIRSIIDKNQGGKQAIVEAFLYFDTLYQKKTFPSK